jgi:hypothetical protein
MSPVSHPKLQHPANRIAARRTIVRIFDDAVMLGEVPERLP